MDDPADPLASVPEEVLLSYLRRVDRGEPVDREALLREHPAHAAAILSFLDLDRQMMAQVAAAPPQASPAAITPGQIIGGAYRIERLLGRGAMGAVYAARHERTGGRFALKVLVLPRDAAQRRQLFLRFRAEARVASALRHPGIVQVVDLSSLPDGSPYIVMEHLLGEDLQQLLARQGRLPLQRALRICCQVGAALHAAHERGIVHRDLKPANIFLSRHREADREIEQAKVIDFGVAHIHAYAQGLTGEISATSEDRFIGTPQYASPEAALGKNAQIDGRSDEFSLAVILYEMISGQRPFQGKTVPEALFQIAYKDPAPLAQAAPAVPAAVAAAVMRALAKKKEDRFPTILDFARALEAAEASAPPRPTPAGRAAWLLGGAGGALLLGAGLLRLTWQGPGPGAAPADLLPAVAVPQDLDLRPEEDLRPQEDPRPRAKAKRPAPPRPAPRQPEIGAPPDPCAGVDCQTETRASVVRQCCLFRR